MELFFFSPAERDLIHSSFVNYVREEAPSILQLSKDTGITRLSLYMFIKDKDRSYDKTYAKIYNFLRKKNVLLFER